MYMYPLIFEANKVVLIYLGEEIHISGKFYLKSDLDNKHCHILQIPANKDFGVWEKRIVAEIKHML